MSEHLLIVTGQCAAPEIHLEFVAIGVMLLSKHSETKIMNQSIF